MIAEQASFLYHDGYFGGYVLLPAFCAFADELQDFIRLYVQVVFVVVPDVFNFIVGDPGARSAHTTIESPGILNPASRPRR